jgi:transcriptional regulator with XRE-family HTH domain
VEPHDFVQDFGDRVRELRLGQGLSQEDLADRAGLHRTAVSFIERAQRSATLETVARLASALGVEPAELMPKLRGRRSGR